MSATTSQDRPAAGDNQQWLRYLRLRVGPQEGGQGIDLSDLRIVFRVNSPIISTPNYLSCRIYNLSDNTVARLLEFNPKIPTGTPATGQNLALYFGNTTGQVILDAGYIYGQKGNIFTGTIVQVRAGRESQTDTYVDIYAQDGDQAHSWGFTSVTLAAGHTNETIAKALNDSLRKYNITSEQLPDGSYVVPAPRGAVLYGATRDFYNDLGRTIKADWTINRGQVQFIPWSKYKAGGGEAIVLTANTGLIGIPELTAEGLSLKCLLNPAIGWGTRIRIDNRLLTANSPGGSTINQPAFNMQYSAINFLPGTSADGFYKVCVADHIGDTRGNEWYTNIIAVALDSSQLPLVQPGLGIPP